MTQKIIASVMLLTALTAEASDSVRVGPQPIRGEPAPSLETAFILREGIYKDTADEFSRWMHEQKHKAIVVVDSPGGSIDSGMSMIRTMQGLKATRGLQTTCIVGNMAASMAAIFVMFCHRTLIIPDGVLMFHRAYYELGGNPEEVSARNRFLTAYLNLLDRQVAMQMGLTTQDYKDLVEHEAWFTGEEAQKAGYVDALVNNFVMPPPPPKNFLEGLFLRLFKLRIGDTDNAAKVK